MTKHLALICLALLSGCSVQAKTVFIADFENTCNYPVEVVAHDYSNAKETSVQKQHLRPGSVAEVLSYISFNDDVAHSFPDTYRLTITANGSNRSLDKQHFLAQLKQSEYQRKGNAIHTWKISDTSLCP